ncbi:hypothetical protein E2320_004896 [Naja naja]|nr:hypothetical protein E2320_004896 [Naja naja]
MTYQLYRKTTLGNSLQKSLDDPIQSQQITPQLSLQFDKAINATLAQRVTNRVNLNTYGF